MLVHFFQNLHNKLRTWLYSCRVNICKNNSVQKKSYRAEHSSKKKHNFTKMYNFHIKPVDIVKKV